MEFFLEPELYESYFLAYHPLYNVEHTFSESFESVVGQSFRDFEWIIVDDCSTDGSLALARKLAESDPRAIVIAVEKNSGSAHARNVCLDHASGRYVTFLDADALLDPNYLESQLRFIQEHGPIISAGYRRKAETTVTDFLVPEETTYNSYP